MSFTVETVIICHAFLIGEIFLSNWSLACDYLIFVDKMKSIYLIHSVYTFVDVSIA